MPSNAIYHKMFSHKHTMNSLHNIASQKTKLGYANKFTYLILLWASLLIFRGVYLLGDRNVLIR